MFVGIKVVVFEVFKVLLCRRKMESVKNKVGGGGGRRDKAEEVGCL